MICLKCGKEIGEEAYFDKATDELIGCDKCCQFDMEQIKQLLMHTKTLKVRKKKYYE